MSFYLVIFRFIILSIVKNAKLLIVTMNVQNAIQKIIVKIFLMGSILENVFVKKAITMICKIIIIKSKKRMKI